MHHPLQPNIIAILADTALATRLRPAIVHAKQYCIAVTKIIAPQLQLSPKPRLWATELRLSSSTGSSFPTLKPLLGGIFIIQRPSFATCFTFRVAVKSLSTSACSISYSIAFTRFIDLPGSICSSFVEPASFFSLSNAGFICYVLLPIWSPLPTSASWWA